MTLDQEPGFRLAGVAAVHAGQREPAGQVLALQGEAQVALALALARILQVPRSQVSTDPAPYSPSGMVPWNDA